MCDPISIIGGLVSVAGSAVQAAQQSSYVSAQNAANKQAYEISKRAREDEQARQKLFEQQAQDYWTGAVDQNTAQQDTATREDATSNFMDSYDKMQQSGALADGFTLSGQDMASDVVKSAIAAKTNTAAADARKRVQALAALSAFDRANEARGQAIGNSANDLSTLNGIRQGSLAVSNQEQNISPAKVTQGSSIFGDVLSGAGGIISSYGGKKPAIT